MLLMSARRAKGPVITAVFSRLLQRGLQEKIDNEYTFFEHSSF